MSSGQRAANKSGHCQFLAGTAQGWCVSPIPLRRESCSELEAIPFPSSFFLLNAPSRCALSFSLPASGDLLMANPTTQKGATEAQTCLAAKI